MTFDPEPDFVGTVQVPYTITDGMDTDDATLTLTIFDEAPEAEDDINATEIDTPVAGNLLLNDSDANPNDVLTITEITTLDAMGNPVITDPTMGPVDIYIEDPDMPGTFILAGTIEITDPTTGDYTFTPETGFVGEAEFGYTVEDSSGKTDTADVSIEVRDTNDVTDPTDSTCLLYTSPSPRDQRGSRMPSSA